VEFGIAFEAALFHQSLRCRHGRPGRNQLSQAVVERRRFGEIPNVDWLLIVPATAR
jgi:hypothetical protein